MSRTLLALFVVMLAIDAHASDTSFWRNADQQGEMLLQQGDADAAARVFTDPRRKAYAKIQAGDFKGAITDLADYQDSESSYNRGNALAFEGDLQGAIDAYDATLKIDPDHTDARHNRDLVAEALKQQSDSGKDQQNNDQQQEEKNKDQQKEQDKDQQANNPSGAGQDKQNDQGESGDQGDQGGRDKRGDRGQQGEQAEKEANDQNGQQGSTQNEQQNASTDKNPAKQKPDQGKQTDQADSEQPDTGQNKPSPGQEQQTQSGQTPDQIGKQQAEAADDAEQARRDAEASLALSNQKNKADNNNGKDAGLEEGNEKDSTVPADTPLTEKQLALEQWLHNIPDDPGGLLRRKFMIEHMMRQQKVRP